MQFTVEYEINFYFPRPLVESFFQKSLNYENYEILMITLYRMRFQINCICM